MTRDEPIIDPRNGRPTTTVQLGRETGISRDRIWYRWDVMGIRSMALLASGKLEVDLDAEREYARRLFFRSPAGRLTTIKRLGDYAQAKRQQENAA